MCAGLTHRSDGFGVFGARLAIRHRHGFGRITGTRVRSGYLQQDWEFAMKTTTRVLKA